MPGGVLAVMDCERAVGAAGLHCAGEFFGVADGNAAVFAAKIVFLRLWNNKFCHKNISLCNNKVEFICIVAL